MFQVPSYPNKKNPVRIRKLPVPGYFFVADKIAREMFNAADSALLTVGHNRAATYGTISADNAHPFWHGNAKNNDLVVGVHNGSLTNFYTKDDFEVDSDWLYHEIYTEGASKALGDINGAYALVWWEQETNRVRIACNGERSIYWAPVRGSNMLVIGSEHNMAYDLAYRNGIVLEQFKYPEKGYIYSWELDKKGDVRGKIDVEAIVESKKSVYSTPSGGTVTPFRQPFNTPTRPHQQQQLALPRGSTESSATGTPTPGTSSCIKGEYTIVTFMEEDKCVGTLNDLNLKFGQEVEFTNCGNPHHGELAGTDFSGWSFSSGQDDDPAGYGDAIMLGADGQTKTNVRECGSAYCRIVGVRKAIGRNAKGEAVCHEYVLVSKPHLLTMNAVARPNAKVFAGLEEESEPELNDYSEAFKQAAGESVLAEIKESNSQAMIKAVDEDAQPTVEGPRRRPITYKEFYDRTKSGCVCCTRDLTIEDASSGTMIWSGPEGDPVCLYCYQTFMSGKA